MGLREQLRRLRREAKGEFVEIPQPDAPPARFPRSALADAFVNSFDRRLGEDTPEHPLSAAARSSPDPEWRDSILVGPEEVPEPPEDLSE